MNTQFNEDDPLVLQTAIALWQNGIDITLDHEVRLLEEGFDVNTLRNKHYK